MNKKIWIILLVLFTACASDKENFRWLEGTWKARTEEGSPVFHESWKWSAEKQLMLGQGFEILGDTSFFESLVLEKRNGKWYYRAIVPQEHGTDTTDFELKSEPNADSLVFNNDENAFPGTITYVRKGENLLNIWLKPSVKEENQEQFLIVLDRL